MPPNQLKNQLVVAALATEKVAPENIQKKRSKAGSAKGSMPFVYVARYPNKLRSKLMGTSSPEFPKDRLKYKPLDKPQKPKSNIDKMTHTSDVKLLELIKL